MWCFTWRTSRVIAIAFTVLAVAAALNGLATPAGAQNSPAPVYRFFNNNAGGHFFTISESEKDTVIANYPWFRYEGIGFYAYPSPTPGASPIYRFFNNNAGGHFFTISESEKDTVISNYSWFRYEGPGFYAFPSQITGTLPIYRFFNNNAGGHFFTLSESEKETVINNYSWFRYEGIGFYAYPSNMYTGAVWQPNLHDTFHLQLRGALTSNVVATIYDVDLFDTSAEQIAQLKQQGRKVVCYFSAGSSENWRLDFASFLTTDMGNPLQGWPGENWLDTRSENVRSIMRTRINLALSKGCDGVDPDNVDGYANPTGFPLTAQDQLDYNRFLSSEAHSVGLAAGLKNDVGQLSELATNFEFAVNEQCHEFAECADYQAFISIGKPVLNVEYQSSYVSNTGGAFNALCDSARAENLRTLVLPLQLDGSFRLSCD